MLVKAQQFRNAKLQEKEKYIPLYLLYIFYSPGIINLSVPETTR